MLAPLDCRRNARVSVNEEPAILFEAVQERANTRPCKSHPRGSGQCPCARFEAVRTILLATDRLFSGRINEQASVVCAKIKGFQDCRRRRTHEIGYYIQPDAW